MKFRYVPAVRKLLRAVGETAGRRRVDRDSVLVAMVCLTFVTFLFQMPITELGHRGNDTLIRWWDLAYLAILVFGLWYFVVRRRTTAWESVRTSATDLKDPLCWALVLAAIAALSLIWAWIGYGSSGFVAETSRVVRLSVVITLAFLIRYGLDDTRLREAIPITIIAIAMVSAVWALVAWLTFTDDTPVPFQMGDASFAVTRAGGPYGNQFANGASDHSWVSAGASNVLGFLLAVALVVALVFAAKEWRQRERFGALAWTFVSGAMVVGLVATHSRESVLAAIVAMLVVVVASSHRSVLKRLLVICGIAAFGLVILIFAVPSFGDRVIESFKPGSYAFETGPQARLDAWLDGLRWGAERFPIGYGIGVIEENPHRFGGATSENVFIQTWAQTGLVGLVALVAFVGTAVRNSFVAVRDSGELSAVFSLSFFSVFVVHGQFGNTLWDPTLLLVAGVALAFAAPPRAPDSGPETVLVTEQDSEPVPREHL